MASGDVFSDTEISMGALALLTIQPAAGVQIIITHTFANSTNIHFCGGGTTLSYLGDAGGNTQFWSHMASGAPMKLLLTNTETISLVNSSTGTTFRAGYTGMEL